VDETTFTDAVDLRAPDQDPWTRLEVPAGWERVAALVRAVASDLDAVADHIVACIRTRVPSYMATATAVPEGDVRTSVTRTIEMMLIGIAERRGPRADEIRVRRELGRRRALQGLGIDPLIEAYRLAYEELWQALVRAVPPHDEDTSTQLLAAAPTVWSWVHELTDAFAGAHLEATRAQEAHVVGARQRFTELVVTGDPESPEVLRLAHSIGFDPEGQFRVAIGRAPVLDGSEARRLQAALDGARGVHAVVARGPRLVITSQDADEEQVAAASRRALPGATFGIGLERDGLAGARTSLGDAERALGVAEEGAVARFQDEWLWATLMRAAPRLYEVLAPGADTAVEHGHLAETVLAFADAGFSVSETARRLELHANTVAYRLERWHALTGWDPRTFTGLTRSLAALRLSTE
jgi:hypothetical protein